MRLIVPPNKLGTTKGALLWLSIWVGLLSHSFGCPVWQISFAGLGDPDQHPPAVRPPVRAQCRPVPPTLWGCGPPLQHILSRHGTQRGPRHCRGVSAIYAVTCLMSSNMSNVVACLCLQSTSNRSMWLLEYASPYSGEAYRHRQLITNFELWVEIFCVPTCFHVRIPKSCLSVCPYPEKRKHLSFVNISPTLVTDTSMERSSRVLQQGNTKIYCIVLYFWRLPLCFCCHVL